MRSDHLSKHVKTHEGRRLASSQDNQSSDNNSVASESTNLPLSSPRPSSVGDTASPRSSPAIADVSDDEDDDVDVDGDVDSDISDIDLERIDDCSQEQRHC